MPPLETNVEELVDFALVAVAAGVVDNAAGRSCWRVEGLRSAGLSVALVNRLDGELGDSADLE